MRLQPALFRELCAALEEAFDLADLTSMLRGQLRRELEDYAADGPKPTRIERLVRDAENKGWLEDLVDAACKVRPENERLQAVSKAFRDAAADQQAEAETIRAKYRDKLRKYINGRPNYPLINPDEKLAVGLKDSGGSFTQSDLLGSLRAGQKLGVRLTGPAGAGKSTLLADLAREILEGARNEALVLLDFKDGDTLKLLRTAAVRDQLKKFEEKTTPSEADYFAVMEQIVACCAPIGKLPDLRQYARHASLRWIFIDGVNELGEPALRDNLVDFLRNAINVPALQMRALFTTRVGADDLWSQVHVEPIAETQRRERIDKKFGTGTYAGLPDRTQQLLELPFFLRIALGKTFLDPPQAVTRAEFIAGFVRAHLPYFGEARGNLYSAAVGFAATEAYAGERTTLFRSDDFRDNVLLYLSKPASVLAGTEARKVRDDLWQQMAGGVLDAEQRHAIQSGAILVQTTATDEFELYRFRHQLLQDYFVSCYLATEGCPEWNAGAFDKVTLRSDSPEPLVMALEQLEPKDGDRLLEAIYDWSWSSSFRCLSDVYRGSGHYSEEVFQVLLGALLEKIHNDPLEAARADAQKIYDLLAKGHTVPDQPQSFHAQLMELARYSPGRFAPAWFASWRVLFLKGPGEPGGVLQETDLHELESGNSFVGWSAANVLRRFGGQGPAGAVDVAFAVRVILRSWLLRRGCASEERVEPDSKGQTLGNELPSPDTVIWRCVHVLGAFPSEESYRLLLQCLRGEQFNWVTVGALRSLCEMGAALASKVNPSGAEFQMANEIVTELSSRISAIDKPLQISTAREIFDAARSPDWAHTRRPLVDELMKVLPDDARRKLENKIAKCSYASVYGDNDEHGVDKHL